MKCDHVFFDLIYNPEGNTLLSAVRVDRNGKQLAMHEDIGVTTESLEDLKRSICGKAFSKHFVVVSFGSDVKRANLAVMTGERPEVFGVNRQWLDLLHLAWPLVYNDMIPSASITDVLLHFGITLNAELPVTTDNVMAISEAYFALMQRYKFALHGEEAVRAIGGNVFQKVRSRIGL